MDFARAGARALEPTRPSTVAAQRQLSVPGNNAKKQVDLTDAEELCQTRQDCGQHVDGGLVLVDIR